ncbi:hypothetical protein ACIBM3_30515 [Rhodococcus erythropolis]|uniref:Rv1733c family protein n=1 Tax=Rhodococcus erythropolis TaxID=1833 RepID=UPI00379C4CED
MRISDRLLATVAIMAVALALLAIPLSATIGTSVYASDRARSEQQHNTYEQWRGTVTTTSQTAPATKEVGAAQKVATWTMNGTERTEPLIDHFSASPGDTITVWTNNDGGQVRPPMDTSLAAFDGVASAVVLCCAAIFGLYITVRITRVFIHRRNLRTWDREWNDMFEQH